MNLLVLYTNELRGEYGYEYVTTIADLVDSFNGDAVLLGGEEIILTEENVKESLKATGSSDIRNGSGLTTFRATNLPLPDYYNARVDEIEKMVHGLDNWEKEARRIVYKFMDGQMDININAFLAINIGTSEGWNALPEYCPKTIRDYYEYMEGDALHDEKAGFNATFAIDFRRMVDDLLSKVIETYRVFDEPTYDVTRDELISTLSKPTLSLQGDSEDGIREWLLSDPKMNDTFLPDANGLWIERVL